jgi:hypothetical protein
MLGYFGGLGIALAIAVVVPVGLVGGMLLGFGLTTSGMLIGRAAYAVWR